jgi:hypothetical protein
MITRRKKLVTRPSLSVTVLMGMLLLLRSSVEAKSRVDSRRIQGRSLKLFEPMTVEDKPVLIKERQQESESEDVVLTVPTLVAAASEVCSVTGRCELCTDSDKENIPECLETGRRQSFVCSLEGTL